MMRKISDYPHEIWGDDEAHVRLGKLGDSRWHVWITGEGWWVDGKLESIAEVWGYATREEAEEALALELLRRAGG